jgi:hypothetical protein
VLAASAGVDVALLVLAGLAGWQLREFTVLGRSSSGIGIDPVLAVAPAIALAAGTVLPLRLLPLLARVGDRLAARTRRLGGALTSWELSRHAARQSAPMLLVVLAVGTSTLALAQHQSWRQSAYDQSAFIAGADVRADTLLPATPGTAGRIWHARGVTSAMAVSTGLSSSNNAQVLAIDARHAAGTVLLRSDEGTSSPSFWRRIEPLGSSFIALPGHPLRLRLTASLNQGRGPGIGPIPVTVTVMDGSGTMYTVPAGTLRPDGRRHGLTARLTSTGQAIYPLKLYAISAGFTLPPPARPRHRPTNRVASFAVTGLATSATLGGPVTDQIPAAALLARWIPSVSAPEFAQTGVGLPPLLIFHKNSKAVPVRFDTGFGFSDEGFSFNSPTTPVQGVVTLRALATPTFIYAIATTAFLKGNNLAVGSQVQIMDGANPINVIIAAQIKSFPTITASGGGLIVDEADVQEQISGLDQPPVPVTEWWLATKGGQVPPGLPPGTTITSRNRLATAVLSDPMSAIPQQAIQATAIAAALLAVLGFSVAVAGSVRERRSQTALLAALGVDGRGQARLLCIEALALSVPAAATGLLLGTVLAHLLVPSVTLTATAVAPIVPVLVKVPLTTATAIALVVTAIPVLAAAGSAIYRPDPAAQLRTVVT